MPQTNRPRYRLKSRIPLAGRPAVERLAEQGILEASSSGGRFYMWLVGARGAIPTSKYLGFRSRKRTHLEIAGDLSVRGRITASSSTLPATCSRGPRHHRIILPGVTQPKRAKSDGYGRRLP